MESTKSVFTLSAAAKILGVGLETLRQQAVDGTIPVVKLGHYRMGILKADLERFAMGHLKQDELIE